MFQLMILKAGYRWYYAGTHDTEQAAHNAAKLFHRNDTTYAIYPVSILEGVKA